MRIDGLKEYQAIGRGKFFEGLTPTQHAIALQWLRRFEDQRRAQGLPIQPWLKGIYYGQAKRLALNPPSSEWGCSMHAKRGGYAVQRKYRWAGRNPTAKATYVRLHSNKRLEVAPTSPTPQSPAARGGYPPPFQPVTVYRGQVVLGKR